MKKTFLLTAIIFCLFFTTTHTPAQDGWQAAADARIEKHRKTDVSVTVTQNGNPVSGATVQVQMKKHEFLFGCNLFMLRYCGSPELNAAYEQRFANLMNFATLGFYWWDYERERGKPDHARREDMARWCAEHGILAKGHPLAWNFMENRWMKDTPSEELWQLQQERITDCVSHFRGKIPVWDVVNELIQFDRGECATNSPQLTEAIKARGRVAAVKECFASARKANPDAVLLVNDYMVYDDYVAFIKQLTGDDGKLIFDAIGLQSHMHSGVWDNHKIEDVCRRYTQFEQPVHFTELTILSGERGWELRDWKSTPEGEEQQAKDVTRVYTMLFSQPMVKAITWWDFSDRGAWMNAPSGLLRADMTPKPAYDALLGLVKGKWWTDETLTTDAAGAARARVFKGDYEVTVTLPDGSQKSFKQTFTGDDGCAFTAEF